VSATKKSAERRRSPRVGVPRVVLKIQSAERLRSNYLKDLSEGGLFLKADRVLPIGSELTVELWPPGWTDPLALESKVVRVVEAGGGATPGMGVSFQNIVPETQEQLQKLLAEHGSAIPDASVPEGDDPLEHVAELVHRVEEERARVAELSAQLFDARGEISAYQEQLQKIERQEGAQRELSEQAAAEVDVFRHRLEEEQEMTRRLQEKVTGLESEIEELRSKESKLRTLLGKAGMGSGGAKASKKGASEPSAESKAARAAPPAASAAASPEVDPSDPFFELAVEDVESGPAVAAPSRPGPPPPPPHVDTPDALEVAFSDVIEDEPIRVQEGGIATEEDLAAFLEEPEETLEVESDLLQEEAELKSSIFDDRVGFDKFSQALKGDTRLLPSDKLAGRSPASVDEALISQFVNASPTFTTLLNQVGGSMKEQRLRQLLYELYARALIDIR
jgi:uncharacterized protein (TIGR02266 family)